MVRHVKILSEIFWNIEQYDYDKDIAILTYRRNQGSFGRNKLNFWEHSCQVVKILVRHPDSSVQQAITMILSIFAVSDSGLC